MKKHILLALALAATTLCHAFEIVNLRVEYTATPLGIDEATPRFSWQMADTGRGAAQKAYAIAVTDERGNTVWDSGKTAGSVSLNISYGGSPLRPTTRYNWTVTVWNAKNKKQTAESWFETGLMATSDKAPEWGGAKWIGGNNDDALTFYSQYLPVFRIACDITLDKATRTNAAAIIYGANDLRLMDRNKNILGVENKRNEAYIKVALNTAPLAKGGNAQIDIYRVGYTQGDKADTPIASAKIPETIINKANQYAPHHIELSSMHGTTNLWIDGNEGAVVSSLNLNPIGRGGDYISFPQVGDVGASVAAGQRATFRNLEIRNFRLPRNTISHIADSMTLAGETRIATPPEHGAPMVRTEFRAEGKQIAKARIYASARGIYNLYVNGTRVGDDYMNPGYTQYNKTLFYQTYDVTPLIKSGEGNAIGAQMSEGWWSGASTFSGESWNFFGDKQSLLAELVITYTDGSVQRVATNPETWQYTTAGPVRIGSMFQGEVFDATREAACAGWATAGFNAAGWRKAVEVPLEGVISHDKSPIWPTPDDYTDFRLTAQIGKPVRPFTTLTSTGVDEVRPGVYVYDMGQNMAGVPKITFRNLRPGQKVYMRYAEVKYPNLPEYKDNVGMVMMENQRGAMEQDIYIAKGGTETFAPRLTYHGFRYIEITGIDAPLPKEDVEGTVLSTVDEFAADYKTNNAKVNRFFENVKWSTLANVFSIPTDCPQRNERMGWSGDLSVFAPTMAYMFNGAEFLRRHLLALRNTQTAIGDFPPIAPVGGGFGGPLWASVGITMPWQSYLQYGDLKALEEHYPAMQRFIDLHTTKYIDKAGGFYNFTDGTGLGDWLGFQVNTNDNSLLFDCYLVHELDIMAGVAKALGKTADAERYTALRKQRADFINSHYINRETGITTRPTFGNADGQPHNGETIDTQTSYALPLVFGIVEPEMRDRFVGNFLSTVARENKGDDGKTYPKFSLMTGFIGTAWISLALSDCGHSDYAYRLFETESFPSWLYPVDQGATTIWERLNSYTKKDGFGGNNSMNSFNHYAFGSVTNWLMQRSLGIARDEAAPGFHHYTLRPEPDFKGTLTTAAGHYDSMYGRIESSWTISPGTTTYRFTLPANTSATLLLPVGANGQVRLDGKPLKKARRLINIGTPTNGKLPIELPSGTYTFTVEE